MCMCVHMYLGYMAEEDAMFLGGKGKSCRGSLCVLARPKVTGWKSFCQRERDMKIAALMKNAKS